jgi:hypothetical protein
MGTASLNMKRGEVQAISRTSEAAVPFNWRRIRQTSYLCHTSRKISRWIVLDADLHRLTGAYLKPHLIAHKLHVSDLRRSIRSEQ